MKILDNCFINFSNHQRLKFLRMEPENLNKTILDIIKELNDLSWINKFDENYSKECFFVKAKPTADYLEEKLKKSIDDEITSETGEYIVSELSRECLVNQFNYLNIPLAELLGRKISGNPGFDFHSVNELDTIIFGEAKYSSSINAYGKGLSQITDFIKKKKDIADLKLIEDFCSKESLNKVLSDVKGYAVGFSSKRISSNDLIKNIKQNNDFLQLLQYEEIIIIAVNI